MSAKIIRPTFFTTERPLWSQQKQQHQQHHQQQQHHNHHLQEPSSTTMGTAPPSKPLNSNHRHHHQRHHRHHHHNRRHHQNHLWVMTNPTDPFHRRGERRRFCVQSAVWMTMPRRPRGSRNNKKRHGSHNKMTVLMKLILLRDWQRVLIRAGLFGDEVSQLCTIPLYRPDDDDDGGGGGGGIDLHASPPTILYCQVLPVHVACALQPPPQVIQVLLLVRRPLPAPKVLPSSSSSSKKNENKRKENRGGGLQDVNDDNECNDVADDHQDQDRLEQSLSTSLAAVPILCLGISDSSSSSSNKSGRHHHDKSRRSWKAFGLRHRHDDNSDNDNNNNNNNNGVDEQRDQEEGCRLLDENANHHFHFERVDLEQQLATNGGSSSAASASVASFPSPSSPSVLLDGPLLPKSRRSRVLGGRRLLGLRRSHYLLDTPDSCLVSLEASIGDGETDEEYDDDDGIDDGIDDEDRGDRDTLLMEDLPKKDSNESGLPLDGWSSYSSIQFVDEDDDENGDGDEGFEYYDAYEADYGADVDDDGIMADGRDDSLLNQFLDQQGIVLQLTPGGEIQPMPIQEARKVATANKRGRMESESVDEGSSGFPSTFSLHALDSYGSGPLGETITAKKTTGLVVTPSALWKSLQLGEDQVLPIHIACLYNASASVVQALLKEYPESALFGVLGLLPIHLAAMAVALPELPFASSGGSSNVYSLLKSQLAPTNPDGTISADALDDNNDHVFMTERLKILIDAAPECLFAKSVAHGMRPVEYAQQLANVGRDGRVTSERAGHQLAIQFLEETEKARLRVQPSSVDEVSMLSNSNSYTFTMPIDVESAQKKSVKCNRTQSSSTCTTAASSSHGAVTMLERHPILKASSSSSSSSPSGTTGLSEMLQHGMWSEAMELLEGDLRLVKKWHYGIDHHKNGAKSTGQETTCTLWKRLPLHIACAGIEAPPIGFLDLLLKAYRGAASCADPHSGYLPLHLACQTHCNLAVIRTLLDAAPGTTKAVDGVLGRLPLHHAIVAQAPYSVLEVLVHHDPRTVSTPDQNGKTPLMLAQCVYLTRKSGESSHGYPRHHPVLSLLELVWM